MILDLYIALCAHHPQSNDLLSPYIRHLPPPTFYPLPSGNHHIAVCVHELQFYIPHMSEVFWFLALSDLLISLSIIFSRSICVVANDSISSFLKAEYYSIVYMDRIFFIQSSIEGHSFVAMSWPL